MSSPNKHPTFSIIAPVYKTDVKVFEQCISSLCNQSYSHLEILIINDGKDSSIQQTCKKLTQKDKRIKYYQQDHQGVSAARNLGIQKASGDYILFVDSDDWLDTSCCRTIADHLDDTTEVYYYSYIKEYPQHSIKVPTPSTPYAMSSFGSTCYKCYKTTHIKQLFFDTTLKNAEDIEYNFRLYPQTQYFKRLDFHPYHYRIAQTSTVRKFDPQIVKKYEMTISAVNHNCLSGTALEKAYINSLAIIYLMLLLNYVYHPKNTKRPYGSLRALADKSYTQTLFKHSKDITLPTTRKIPILLAKYHCYFLLKCSIKIKQLLDR